MSPHLPSFLFIFVSYRSVMFGSCGEVALCRRHTIGPRNILLSGHYSYVDHVDFFKVGLTTTGTLDGGNEPTPICLIDSASHGCAGPTVCKVRTLQACCVVLGLVSTHSCLRLGHRMGQENCGCQENPATGPACWWATKPLELIR